METLDRLLSVASDWAWGAPMLALLFGTHIFLTIRLRVIQRFIGKAIRLSLTAADDAQGDISHFGSLTTALAATVGTGNLAGVATAVAAGGPGAVLWMWLTGVFGISTKYAEGLLAVKYRVATPDGRTVGGPMYVLERGLRAKWLGMLFAAFAAFAAFGIGNIVQANTIAEALNTRLSVPAWGTGLILAGLTAVTILGGIRWIARVCEALVPFMAVFYVVGCLILLVINASSLPDTFVLIVKGAFSGQAAVGGFLGVGMKEAVRFGIARGLFSNESGLGSAPIVAAAARTRNPVRQALVSSSGTFWDTVVICLMTGLVIVNSGDWESGADGIELTQMAFEDLSVIGPFILSVGLVTFVFSTILGWSYYGERACEYLFGPGAIRPYQILWVVAVFVGSVQKVEVVWNFADLANALMAVPNLISLLLLSGVVVKETRKYLWDSDLDA